MWIDAAIVENCMEVSQKNKENYHMTQKFHPGYISEEIKNTNLERYMYPSVCSSIV